MTIPSISKVAAPSAQAQHSLALAVLVALLLCSLPLAQGAKAADPVRAAGPQLAMDAVPATGDERRLVSI